MEAEWQPVRVRTQLQEPPEARGALQSAQKQEPPEARGIVCVSHHIDVAGCTAVAGCVSHHIDVAGGTAVAVPHDPLLREEEALVTSVLHDLAKPLLDPKPERVAAGMHILLVVLDHRRIVFAFHAADVLDDLSKPLLHLMPWCVAA